MTPDPKDVVAALKMAQGDVSFVGTSKEYPAVLADAVRLLAKRLVGDITIAEWVEADDIAKAVVAMEGE